MAYYYSDREHDNRQYEDWHRFGSERGFFERASDEIRSWFGDEEAEYRRQLDESRRDRPRAQAGRYGYRSVPDWQRRNYSGSSPRGSWVEPHGRYDEPEAEQQPSGMKYSEEPREDLSRQRPRFFEQRHERGAELERGGWMIGPRELERESSLGQYRGRGPRNYQRSDNRILDEINEELTMHPDLDASDVEVVVENAVVTLKGAVENRHAKRLAEDICEEAWGVKEVHNELRIERPEPRYGRSGQDDKRNRDRLGMR